ncbi:MAG TPA: DinB family protein [Membranihabitans sp.]|nr:DinB family protein [Membranihabitans sp.]
MIHKYPYQIHKPGGRHIPEYYRNYVSLVPVDEGFTALIEGATGFIGMLSTLPPDRLNYTYAPGKWTVQQVLLHVIDTERVFQARVLKIARQDPQPMFGFDQDLYVAHLPHIDRSLESIRDEYETVRKSTFLLYAGLTKGEMKLQGHLGDVTLSLPTIPFIIAGHEIHHMKLLKERYNIVGLDGTVK